MTGPWLPSPGLSAVRGPASAPSLTAVKSDVFWRDALTAPSLLHLQVAAVPASHSATSDTNLARKYPAIISARRSRTVRANSVSPSSVMTASWLLFLPAPAVPTRRCVPHLLHLPHLQHLPPRLQDLQEPSVRTWRVSSSSVQTAAPPLSHLASAAQPELCASTSEYGTGRDELPRTRQLDFLAFIERK